MIEIIALIITLVICAIPFVIPCWIAASRERSWFGWLLLSIILTPLITIILLLVLPNPKKERLEREEQQRRHWEMLAAVRGNQQIVVNS